MSDAQRQGYKDYQDGKALWENPFDSFPENQDWVCGWHDASDDNWRYYE